MDHTSGWRRPVVLLVLFSVAMPVAFGTWQALLNNFAVERAGFTGAEMGWLQSVREVPGFLAFAVVFLLWVLREQTLAVVSLLLLGLGTALTGFFPSFAGLMVTTFVMSVGFHYFETVKTSLTLQWIDKADTAKVMGRLISAGSFASLASFGLIWLAIDVGGLSMAWVYLIGGGLCCVLAVVAWVAFPVYPARVEQNRHLVLRRRYGLYYLLTFMAGARRQIFVVFAGFLMVERFGLDVATMSLLFLVNHGASMVAAPWIGRLVGLLGERRALAIEYAGLVGVFVAYAVVDHVWLAAGLYVVDHVLFAMAIALKTYFQKIADPADIAPTAGVAFTINHIAAVAIPAGFGLLWLVSPAAVFLAGAAMAGVSLVLSRFVPEVPGPGNEVWRPGAVHAG